MDFIVLDDPLLEALRKLVAAGVDIDAIPPSCTIGDVIRLAEELDKPT